MSYTYLAYKLLSFTKKKLNNSTVFMSEIVQFEIHNFSAFIRFIF